MFEGEEHRGSARAREERGPGTSNHPITAPLRRPWHHHPSPAGLEPRACSTVPRADRLLSEWHVGVPEPQ